MSLVQTLGAACFGGVIGWYVYYINRYKTEAVKLTDLVTVIGIIGGSTVLTLFPAGTDLFGGYGIGLAFGFFGYFAMLLLMVGSSKNFDVDWFLDGRSKKPTEEYVYPKKKQHPMGVEEPEERKDNDH